MDNFFNIDGQYNLHLPSGVYLKNIPTIPGTSTTVLVAGPDGQISTATVDQLTASESAVTSVFGRIGAVTSQTGDYLTSQITESGNLYFTTARARAAISITTTGTNGAATYVNGVLNIPNYSTDLTGYATETYVTTQVANLVDSAPTTLNTLNELAAALGDDANFATTITTLIGTKEPAITAGTTAQYWRGDKTWQTLPIYTLPKASASVLGGIKVGANLSIDADGILSAGNSYVLPTASASVLGGIKVGTNLSIDANGVLSSSYTDTNTNYSLTVPNATTKIRLSGSDAVNSDITLTAGDNVTITRTSATEITIASSYIDTNTVTRLRRVDSDGATNPSTYRSGDLTLRPGNNVTITEPVAGVYQIASSFTDTNTTYSVSAADGTTGKKVIRLTGSDSTTDDVTLVAGTNVTLGRSGDEITINSTYVDTDTITQIRRIDADGTTGGTTYRTGNITLRAGTNVAITETTAGVFQFVSSDTTYAVFTAATNPGGVVTAGVNGLVPAPAVLADNAKFLRGDGTWVTPTDTNTWIANTKDDAGYVAAPGAVANRVWKTDANGNPAWRVDADTTYSVFGAATANDAGTSGLVPGPAAGQQGRFLRGDATWVALITSVFGGATADAAGSIGFVPAPAAGQQSRFLQGNGTWGIPVGTTYSVFGGASAGAAGSSGLVPGPAAGDQAKFLRADGTWAADNNTWVANSKDNAGYLAAGTGNANKVWKTDGTGAPAWRDDADTDTVYVHPTTAGNKHIPAGGAAGEILRWSADGTAVWGADIDTNTWQANTKDNDGYVTKGTGNASKVWKTDADGVPGWRTDADTDTWVANTKDAAGYVSAPGAVANKVWKTDSAGNPGWRDDADTDTNTWQANTKTQDGYVTAPGAIANKVWKTDANGNPGWRDDADTDTNTTYSAGAGLTLSGTTFSVTKTITTASTADTIALRDASANLTAAGFFQSSSRLLKTDVNPYTESALDILKRTNVVSFYYKTDLENRRIGFIAEDTPVELSTKDKNVMDANSTIGLLIKAVQELEARIKQLEDEK